VRQESYNQYQEWYTNHDIFGKCANGEITLSISQETQTEQEALEFKTKISATTGHIYEYKVNPAGFTLNLLDTKFLPPFLTAEDVYREDPFNEDDGSSDQNERLKVSIDPVLQDLLLSLQALSTHVFSVEDRYDTDNNWSRSKEKDIILTYNIYFFLPNDTLWSLTLFLMGRTQRYANYCE
jgi:hypothetical protein